MQKITLTDPNEIGILRCLLEDEILSELKGGKYQTQKLFELYQSLGGYWTWEQFERFAKPAPKTVWGWLKEIFGGA